MRNGCMFAHPARTADVVRKGTPASHKQSFLAPALPPTLTRDSVIEDVLLVRDELANLARAVERTTRDADGTALDRYRRYLQLRPAKRSGLRRAGGAARTTYRLGTSIPDYWYPLAAASAPDGRPALALASMPPEATGVPYEGVRGTLVPHVRGPSSPTKKCRGEGAHVTRVDRIVIGGSGVLVWRARTKAPGSGEGSSGLRFDVLESERCRGPHSRHALSP